MRGGRFLKRQWDEVDRIFRAEIKKTLNLPQEAANEYLYGPRSAGLFGISNAATTSDQAIIDTAFKLLTSPEDFIFFMALQSLDLSIEKRTRNNTTDPLRARFLSGDINAPFNTIQLKAKIQPSDYRLPVRERKKSNHESFYDSEPTLQVGPVEINREKTHSALMELRTRSQQANLTRLLALRSQGKAIECTASTQASTHFMADGKIHHTAALKHHILSSDQKLQGMTGLRPDLVIVRRTKAIVIDITVAFENRLEALSAARQEKSGNTAPWQTTKTPPTPKRPSHQWSLDPWVT
ncbi:hypothetical protein CBL_08591 [Carabus blaptoides fortunei]